MDHLPVIFAEFNQKLSVLEEQFSSLKPELELTVRDPSLDGEGHVVMRSTFASRGGPLGCVGRGGTRLTPTVTPEENAQTRANVVRARALTEERISGNVKKVLSPADSLSIDFVKAGRYVALKFYFE